LQVLIVSLKPKLEVVQTITSLAEDGKGLALLDWYVALSTREQPCADGTLLAGP
jgi:hypothetical protein